ncbi:MAG: hypothetical protein Q9157_004005 [Trypethelium eluteriae]
MKQHSLCSNKRTANISAQCTGVNSLKAWPHVDELYNEARQPFGLKELDHEMSQGRLRVYGVGQTGDIPTTANDHETTEAGGLSGKDVMDIKSTFDQPTADRLYRIYIAKVHVLYPFLDMSWLYQRLTEFIDKCALVLEKGSPMLGRTLTDSIISLVLANGLLHEHEGPLPSPNRPESMHKVSESGPSPTSSQGCHQRNLDLIPGLKLYAHSLDTLTFFAFYQTQTFDSERPLLQVWAFILASIYMGRLARAWESRQWLDKACEAWLVLKEKISNTELGMPTSDLGKHAANMGLPHNDDGFFHAQIELYKIVSHYRNRDTTEISQNAADITLLLLHRQIDQIKGQALSILRVRAMHFAALHELSRPYLLLTMRSMNSGEWSNVDLQHQPYRCATFARNCIKAAKLSTRIYSQLWKQKEMGTDVYRAAFM